MSAISELAAAGYTRTHTSPCPKCGVPIETWRNPEGKEVQFNVPEHPTLPSGLHVFSCGEAIEDHTLPQPRRA